jgi:hypothetical protein
MEATTPYPESEKLHAVHETSQMIGEFIEWLPTRGKFIGTWRTLVDCPGGGAFSNWTCESGVKVHDRTGEDGGTCPVCDGKGVVEASNPIPEIDYVDINKLLAEFFNIDLAKVDLERRAMLDALRAANT